MKRIGCKGLCWLLTLLSLACLFGCAGEGSPTPEATQAAVTWDTLEFDRSMGFSMQTSSPWITIRAATQS